MNEIQKEILSRIKPILIDCPDCEYMNSDDQYTCTTCWYEGGSGKINVFDYLKSHKDFLEDQPITDKT